MMYFQEIIELYVVTTGNFDKFLNKYREYKNNFCFELKIYAGMLKSLSTK